MENEISKVVNLIKESITNWPYLNFWLELIIHYLKEKVKLKLN